MALGVALCDARMRVPDRRRRNAILLCSETEALCTNTGDRRFSASQSVTPGLLRQTGVVGELVGELIRVDFELRDILQLHVAIQLQTARRLTDTVAATHMECVVFAVLLSTTATMAFSIARLINAKSA